MSSPKTSRSLLEPWSPPQLEDSWKICSLRPHRAPQQLHFPGVSASWGLQVPKSVFSSFLTQRHFANMPLPHCPSHNFCRNATTHFLLTQTRVCEQIPAGKTKSGKHNGQHNKFPNWTLNTGKQSFFTSLINSLPHFPHQLIQRLYKFSELISPTSKLPYHSQWKTSYLSTEEAAAISKEPSTSCHKTTPLLSPETTRKVHLPPLLLRVLLPQWLSTFQSSTQCLLLHPHCPPGT